MEGGPSIDNQAPRVVGPLWISCATRYPTWQAPKADSYPPQVAHTTANLTQDRVFDTAGAQGESPASQAVHTTTDPHILITFASQTTGMTIDVSPMRHLRQRVKFTPTTWISPQLAIINALHTIAICEARGQVVAISVQLDDQNQTIQPRAPETGEVLQR